jgi:hypothetical protein
MKKYKTEKELVEAGYRVITLRYRAYISRGGYQLQRWLTPYFGEHGKGYQALYPAEDRMQYCFIKYFVK